MISPAALVCDFVNSYDVESGTDAIPSPAALVAWLGRRGLTGPDDTASAADLATAVDLREGLRAALRLHHGRGPGGGPGGEGNATGGNTADGNGDGGNGAADELRFSRALDRLPLTLTLTGETPALEPAVTGALAGLARIAAAVMAVHAEGNWPRLKVCTESTCQWAFLDSSKNRSRSWCSMKVCGNRTKTRAYRARRQSETSSRHLGARFPDTV
ncbi:hypothetical protein GCM10010156_01550 [Planobispora rosea]|uniref:Zinc finger CGNR domain-containing protein n=1 Tax=Planobispora rosea TaxID=35762 RepID=A0A8J3RYE0_PLARO|nr:CGNR zinc finger domain-containing protein [Planobispora rosea]GGS46556.1 hypothetical protein GCM10010156_01550 [Planobispora rosea]GIH82332.1 hypothetical protein Pro02_07400 [Planobispora rosea]